MSASAFHISGTIIQSCLTAMGPTGNHWLGPLARMKTSYTLAPSSSMVSYLAAAASSASVGGMSTFFSPEGALRRLGFWFCACLGFLADFLAAFSAAFLWAVLDMPPGAGAASREGAGALENSSGPARVMLIGSFVFEVAADRAVKGAATREERAAARARTGARAETVVVVIASILAGVSAAGVRAGGDGSPRR